MTIAKDFAAKASVALVAAAMVFTSFAPAAKAQSMDSLLAQIAALTAQIEALKGGNMGGGSGAAVCPYTWTRDLRTGATGADVKALQQFLNSDADTRVAATGAGSAGMETETFGPMTATAVSKFQTKYRADILAPNGLVAPTGTFGPSSRNKANALCVATTGGGEDDMGGDDDSAGGDDEDDTTDADLSGEGTLDTFEMDDASDNDIEEGSEEEVVGEITMEATDGDIEVDRITFEINDGSVANTEPDAWDVFEAFSLWVDGEMIAEFDASDEDNYLDEDDGEFRFSGLGLVLREDEEVEVMVAATVAGTVDGADGAATARDWVLTATAVRYFDADGVSDDDRTTDELPTATANFEIVEEGDGEELKFALADSNPDESDIIVDSDDTTKDVVIMEYTMEAEESDIDIDTLKVKITTVNSTSSSDVIDDVYLKIDGKEFDAENSASTTGNVTTFEFDIDDDVTVAEGEEVMVEVVVDLKSQENGNVTRYSNGTTIMAEVGGTEVDLTVAEGAENLGASELTGSAIGETHTLLAAGVTDTKITTDQDGGGDSAVGTFTFEVELKAIEENVYISTTTSATALTAGPFRMTVVGGTATSSYIVQSDATVESGYFRINDGATETFTITVSVDPLAAGSFYVILDDVRFRIVDPGAANRTFDFTPQSNFDTSAVSIKAS
jgi:hypothetical protein